MRNFLKRFINEENEMIRHNQKGIDVMNYYILRFVIIISVVGFLCLTILTFIIDNFSMLHMTYVLPFIISIIFLLIYHKRPPHQLLVIGMYLIFVLLLIVTVYLSAIISPKSQAASVIGVFLLMPILIIDKTWRVVFITLVFYMIFIASSFLCKEFIIAIDDAVTCGFFMLVGNILGYYMRGIQMTNIESQHRLKRLSDTDSLTRLYNRRKLDATIQNKDHDFHTTGVIMIDIDFFKQFNDEYGHQAGDVCLEEVGACLYRIARLYHLKAYRYGGEEFVILSSHHSFDDLYMIANEIRKEIKRLQITFDQSPFKLVTISAGVSECMVCRTPNVYELINKADKALYHGKKSGRNIVVGYSIKKDN